MSATSIFILPGWQNSGPLHWQSLWQTRYKALRVEQHDWMRPLRGDWTIQLEEAILGATQPVLLVAHSLGCQLVAAWAAHSRHSARVQGALLVAPADVECDSLRSVLPSWSPPLLKPLPFRSTVVASSDDPYCSLARSEQFAQAWGAQLVNVGACGHINADSGLGEWPQGQALLQALMT